MPWKKRTVSGGASWVQDSPNGSLVYDNNAESFDRRAIAYSTDTFQSDGGFKLTVGYLTGSIDDTAGHNFSFGLISTETDLSTYGGFNPFRADTSVYSIGTNLTTDIDPSARGLNFTNGSTRTTLDESGTNVQFGTNLRFQTNESNVVVIEITPGGNWTYSINGITEASGVIAEGFDLSKSYRVAVYGQDDHGDGKVIQHLSLECKVTPEENFATWAAAHGLAGVDALIDSDTSDHDGYSNLMEFALGMNPTVADPRSRDYYTSVIEGENHFFVYEYYRRSDCVAQGLSYELEVSPDLQNPVTNPPFDADVGDSINGFEKVTSRFLIDDPEKFIRLKVKSLPQ